MPKKKISIIIRCKNEERWIGYTIQSILDNIKIPEIIVVDNDSNDNSLNIVKSFAHDPKLTINEKYAKIKIIKIKDYSPGKALNKGVKAASGDIVIIISYAFMEFEEAKNFQPTVIFPNETNNSLH